MLGVHYERVVLTNGLGMLISMSDYCRFVVAKFSEENGGPPRLAEVPYCQVDASLEFSTVAILEDGYRYLKTLLGRCKRKRKYQALGQFKLVK